MIKEGASLSGLERNHLFLNEGGRAFSDVSGVSGLDNLADGRSMAILDFDRDGWLDFVVTNANNPRTLLFRNRIGERAKESGAAIGGSVALRLEGGNRRAEASSEWSNRDGTGTIVEVDVDGQTLLREFRAGEGRGGQNSSTLLIGIGLAEQADALRVRWPSGKVQTIEAVPEGTLLTAYENPLDGPGGLASVMEPYLAPESVFANGRNSMRPSKTLKLTDQTGLEHSPRLVLYTTMATWCGSCFKELPALKKLRESFDDADLAMVGVPYDEKEDAKALTVWERKNRPAYTVAATMPQGDVDSIKRVLIDELKIDALPATLITDRAGNILLTRFGPPTISEIHRLLFEAETATQ